MCPLKRVKSKLYCNPLTNLSAKQRRPPRSARLRGTSRERRYLCLGTSIYLSVVGTWWFGLPNSPVHCLIGALIGVALGNALARSRSISEGVHWAQLWKVLEALALSPILGFVLAGALYFLCRRTLHDKHLYEPATDTPPIWWMRGILILTCSGVSFAHGTNDGQKSICRHPFILSICPFIDVNCTFRGVSGLHEAVPMALAVRGRPRLSLVP